jgi:AmmeMemoRadiSam system protein B
MTSMTPHRDPASVHDDGPSRDAWRPTAVAGTFYPADRDGLCDMVDRHLSIARGRAETCHPPTGDLLGLLVPHAGLSYSGRVAASAWSCLTPGEPVTVVLLGTNHTARWLVGIGAWESGAWGTPLGDVGVDAELAATILDLGEPFVIDRRAHLAEHSIEVQLPYLRRLVPEVRIVPLAVSMGTGAEARLAGRRLGERLDSWRRDGGRVLLAISSDAAHYPTEADSRRVTELLRPALEAIDPWALAVAEAGICRTGMPGLACGMCGIEPTVVGLAALQAMGAVHGWTLDTATSADEGGDRERTVGYLAGAFTS